VVSEIATSLAHDLVITPAVNFIKETVIAPLSWKVVSPVFSRV